MIRPHDGAEEVKAKMLRQICLVAGEELTAVAMAYQADLVGLGAMAATVEMYVSQHLTKNQSNPCCISNFARGYRRRGRDVAEQAGRVDHQ